MCAPPPCVGRRLASGEGAACRAHAARYGHGQKNAEATLTPALSQRERGTGSPWATLKKLRFFHLDVASRSGPGPPAPPPQPGPLTTEAFRALAVVPSPVVARNVLFADPRFWAQYAVRPIEIDGLWFNVLQRKDTLESFVER